MHVHLGHRDSQKKLPEPVQKYMRCRFNLLPEYLENLRCFEYDDVINGETVKRVRIFSPTKARQQSIKITSLTDLDKYPGIFLYEGYVNRQGKAYVADRRSPMQINKK